MTTYLLPAIRTPGDSAHINEAGLPLCGQRMAVATLESNYLCAFNVCPAREQLAAQWVQVSFIDGVGSLAATAINKTHR